MTMPSDLHDRRYQPTDPTAALATATAAMYDAFSAEAFDPAMLRVPAVVSDDDLAALGGPVDTLAPEVLGRFVLRSMTSWGGPDDLRRVTPRALALAADNQLPVHRTVLWSKLLEAGWPDWPAAEVDAVHRFLAAEWARLVRAAPRPSHAVHRWLGPAAVATGDLTWFLDDWHEALGPLTFEPHHRAAVGHLVVLLVDSPLRPDVPTTVEEIVPGPPSPAARQLTAWLAGPGTAHQLARAADELADTRDARRVRLAVDRLARFAAACGEVG